MGNKLKLQRTNRSKKNNCLLLHAMQQNAAAIHGLLIAVVQIIWPPTSKFFKTLDKSYISKVRIGNREFIDVKGKWVVVVDTQVQNSFLMYYLCLKFMKTCLVLLSCCSKIIQLCLKTKLVWSMMLMVVNYSMLPWEKRAFLWAGKKKNCLLIH